MVLRRFFCLYRCGIATGQISGLEQLFPTVFQQISESLYTPKTVKLIFENTKSELAK